jgi:hypothetical protein
LFAEGRGRGARVWASLLLTDVRLLPRPEQTQRLGKVATKIRFVGMGATERASDGIVARNYRHGRERARMGLGLRLRLLGCDLRDPNSADLVLFFERKRRQERSTKQAATGIANRRDAGRHHRLPVVPPPPTRLPHHPSGRSPCLLRLRTLGHKPSK